MGGNDLRAVTQFHATIANLDDPQLDHEADGRRVDGDEIAFAHFLFINYCQARVAERDRSDADVLGADLEKDRCWRRELMLG